MAKRRLYYYEQRLEEISLSSSGNSTKMMSLARRMSSYWIWNVSSKYTGEPIRLAEATAVESAIRSDRAQEFKPSYWSLKKNIIPFEFAESCYAKC